MPVRPEGVYQDGRGGWYFKVTVGRDPLTGKRDQITKRGFRTAAEAGRERRCVVAKIDRRQLAPSSAGLTLKELSISTSTGSTPTRCSPRRPATTTGPR